MRRFPRALAAPILALAASAGAARAQPVLEVTLAELIGGAPAEVQARLGAAGAAVPSAGLTAQGAGGAFQLFELGPFGASATSDRICYAGEADADQHPSQAPLLVFREGRLAGAVLPGPPRPPMTPPPTTLKAADDYMRAPSVSAIVARPGELPLESGLDDLPERLGAPLAAQARLVRKCWMPRPIVSAPGKRHFDDAGFFQGLALLPLAVGLPRLNAERARAQAEGPRTLAELRLGDRLEGGAEGFARRHGGVFVEPGGPGYSILVINLGAEPSNNVSRMNDAAFAGVRDGKVEWIAPSMRLEPGYQIGHGLCEGPDRRPTRARRGCTAYGFFSP